MVVMDKWWYDCIGDTSSEGDVDVEVDVVSDVMYVLCVQHCIRNQQLVSQSVWERVWKFENAWVRSYPDEPNLVVGYTWKANYM